MQSTKEKLQKLNRNKAVIICRYVFSALAVLYGLAVWIMCWIKVPFTLKGFLFSLIPIWFLVSLFFMNDLFILIGQGITIVSDLFLILLGKQEIGICIFIFVQIAYAIYFARLDKCKKRIIIISVLRPVLIGILMPLAWLVTKPNFNAMVIISMIYFPNLVINAIHAAILKKWYLFIALIFFSLCDLNLGLVSTLPDCAFKKALTWRDLTHIFYIPSQLMIAFSKHWYDQRAKYKSKK